MGSPEDRLTLEISAQSEVGEEELERLTSTLRRELLQLDLEDVRPAPPRAPPARTRGAEAAALGTLLVTLGKSAGELRSLVTIVRGWLSRTPVRSIRLELDGDVLEVSGVSSDAQEKLIEAFLARHAPTTTLADPVPGSDDEASRDALIVAIDSYDDPSLRALRALSQDAASLARVLGHPDIGGLQGEDPHQRIGGGSQTSHRPLLQRSHARRPTRAAHLLPEPHPVASAAANGCRCLSARVRDLLV